MNGTNLFQESIIRDMSEGVLTIAFDGVIGYVNPAAEEILNMRADMLVGKRFALCFFEYAENDRFTQAVLDAVYDRDSAHRSIVPYFDGNITRQLQVTSSFLMNGSEKAGLIVVFNDISELSELRDAVKAMERIRTLNSRLDKRYRLLSETFGRFLSDDIVRELLETPDGLALGGRKRKITIMMSDLRGFTAMSERMEPGKLLSMLNHYLGEMTEIIQKHGGTIIEFIGDGIMAIFGAPAYFDDHAEKAVAAGVEMQSRMVEVNRWNEENGCPALEMGIGINTGDVIVGNIGSEKRTKYGVVGSQVNLTGRIESYTVGGQVLISPTTRSLIKAPMEIGSELEVSPKGVNEKIVLSQVVGLGAPYHVHASVHSSAPNALARPIDVKFSVIDGKHCSDADAKGVFTAVSDSQAVLFTNSALRPLDTSKSPSAEMCLQKCFANLRAAG
ncbi:MAG: PAS domain-containing protein [Clostridia bacterium]|nr:PAS domain-containing protein [Clostridia bacterium]